MSRLKLECTVTNFLLISLFSERFHGFILVHAISFINNCLVMFINSKSMSMNLSIIHDSIVFSEGLFIESSNLSAAVLSSIFCISNIMTQYIQTKNSS